MITVEAVDALTPGAKLEEYLPGVGGATVTVYAHSGPVSGRWWRVVTQARNKAAKARP